MNFVPAGKFFSAILKNSVIVLSSLLVSNVYTVHAADRTEVLGDYHISLYNDMYGDVMELEAFTKMVDKAAYFGLGCSTMSPFPVFQVLLFDDEILSETPKFMSASYSVKGLKTQPVSGLQAVLKPTLNADEISNKLRIEMSSEGAQKALRLMNEGYREMLNQFSQGQVIQVSFEHRKLGKHDYQFSLKGMQALLERYGSICMK
ncbi:hypothetical protein [Thiomicrorhabdus indica]|uniref:hypothetical protein n=1 Tax=Thiomicrorhabdus indica TaxID=2267253 RepID=UPI00102DE4A2|nr:hypothetical protein [Thiomicrorhabdus indica]